MLRTVLLIIIILGRFTGAAIGVLQKDSHEMDSVEIGTRNHCSISRILLSINPYGGAIKTTSTEISRSHAQSSQMSSRVAVLLMLMRVASDYYLNCGS